MLDAHRPWNLDNIFGSQIIQCFDDGTVDDTLGEQKEAYYKLLELDEESGDDELSGDGNDNNGGDDEATDADEVTDEDEEDEDETISNKRGNSSIDRMISQKESNERSKSMNMKVFWRNTILKAQQWLTRYLHKSIHYCLLSEKQIFQTCG